MQSLAEGIAPHEQETYNEWYDPDAGVSRANQRAPEDNEFQVWLVMAGRGFGKTRTGAEWVRWKVESGEAKRVALVGRTAADVRDVMVEGPAGLLTVCPDPKPKYESSRRRVVWNNGAIAHLYSADEPDLLRGPQHDLAWCDELAAWRRLEAYDMLMLGLRLGKNPQVCITTTPRPIKHVKDLLEMARTSRSVRVTRGSTFDNLANLAPTFSAEIIKRYEGTRLGRQELYAEILDDVPGALWHREMLDTTRVTQAPDLARIVVGVDPAATDGEGAAETGIIVAGIGYNEHVYVLEDLTLRASPAGWASQVVAAYHKYEADRIVAEVNQGGDMVTHTIRTVDNTVAIRTVSASRGKVIRAEPVAALYEQGRVHHLGMFDQLEDQLCSWVPGDTSPDRLDALVWALTELALGKPEPIASMSSYTR